MIVRKLEIKIDPSSLDQAIREAEHYLAHADPVMRRLIARHGPCPLAEREFEPFHMLANSIISQQLSTKAAATIKQRVGELVGVPFQTEKVLAVSSEKLRDAGLSQAKARYIRELAARVVDGRLIFDELMAIEDEAVIRRILTHLELPTEVPVARPSRAPPIQFGAIRGQVEDDLAAP